LKKSDRGAIVNTTTVKSGEYITVKCEDGLGTKDENSNFTPVEPVEYQCKNGKYSPEVDAITCNIRKTCLLNQLDQVLKSKGNVTVTGKNQECKGNSRLTDTNSISINLTCDLSCGENTYAESDGTPVGDSIKCGKKIKNGGWEMVTDKTSEITTLTEACKFAKCHLHDLQGWHTFALDGSPMSHFDFADKIGEVPAKVDDSLIKSRCAKGYTGTHDLYFKCNNGRWTSSKTKEGEYKVYFKTSDTLATGPEIPCTPSKCIVADTDLTTFNAHFKDATKKTIDAREEITVNCDNGFASKNYFCHHLTGKMKPKDGEQITCSGAAQINTLAVVLVVVGMFMI
jgi:hypothetical protein